MPSGAEIGGTLAVTPGAITTGGGGGAESSYDAGLTNATVAAAPNSKGNPTPDEVTLIANN